MHGPSGDTNHSKDQELYQVETGTTGRDTQNMFIQWRNVSKDMSVFTSVSAPSIVF